MKSIEDMILRKLRNGPAWAKSFHHAKPVVKRMVDRGVLIRVAPVGGTQKNMIAIKEKTDESVD